MKKLLALTLTVIMALSLFVMPAYAEAELPAFTDNIFIFSLPLFILYKT